MGAMLCSMRPCRCGSLSFNILHDGLLVRTLTLYVRAFVCVLQLSDDRDVTRLLNPHLSLPPDWETMMKEHPNAFQGFEGNMASFRRTRKTYVLRAQTPNKTNGSMIQGLVSNVEEEFRKKYILPYKDAGSDTTKPAKLGSVREGKYLWGGRVPQFLIDLVEKTPIGQLYGTCSRFPVFRASFLLASLPSHPVVCCVLPFFQVPTAFVRSPVCCLLPMPRICTVAGICFGMRPCTIYFSLPAIWMG
jgi:hypothetical protein